MASETPIYNTPSPVAAATSMNNIKKTECNGPKQTTNEMPATENHKKWNCAETNNGYLKSNLEQQGDPLLGATPLMATVVQVTEEGAKTVVIPNRGKASRERCLLITVLALVLLSGVSLLLLANKNETGCNCAYGKSKCLMHYVLVSGVRSMEATKTQTSKKILVFNS